MAKVRRELTGRKMEVAMDAVGGVNEVERCRLEISGS
jgi:hypothetical protein